MTPSEKALDLKQQFGLVTMFSEANNGYTLPESIAAKMAIICVKEIIQTMDLESYTPYWGNVLKELEK